MENDVVWATPLDGPDTIASTVPLVSSCLKAFKILSSALDDIDILDQFPLRKAIDECNGRFRIWSGNIGGHQTGKGSLDYRLRDASHIKTRVLRLLEDLVELLSDATSIVTGARQPLEEVVSDGDSSDTETESESGECSSQSQGPSEMRQILTEVSEVVNCLYRLSMSVRNPTGTQRYIKSAHIDTSFYEPYDLKYVEQKFPSAKGYLVERLGKAISRRRQYLKYRETHAAKMAQRLDEENTTTVRSETTATALLVQSEPQEDSRSVSSESSYATSTGSAHKARMPSMPKEARAGLPFECPYCRTIEVVKNTHAWMKHVYKDLQPYMCTSENCATPHEMYEGRRQWFNHELQKHRRSWRCHGHCNQPFTSEDALAKHVRKHLSGQYSDAQISVLVEMWAGQTDMHAESPCPLCRERVAGTMQLQKHQGRHLEEIALFALPSEETESDEDSDSQSSSLVGEEPNPPPSCSQDINILCDTCQADRLTRYYHCSTCDYGSFDICQRCFDMGNWCQNREHSMVEHCADRSLERSKVHHWQGSSEGPEVSERISAPPAYARGQLLVPAEDGISYRSSAAPEYRHPAPVIVNNENIAVVEEDQHSQRPRNIHGRHYYYRDDEYSDHERSRSRSRRRTSDRERSRPNIRDRTSSPYYGSEYEIQSRLKRLELLEKQAEDERERRLKEESFIEKAKEEAEEEARRKHEEDFEKKAIEEYKDKIWKEFERSNTAEPLTRLANISLTGEASNAAIGSREALIDESSRERRNEEKFTAFRFPSLNSRSEDRASEEEAKVERGEEEGQKEYNAQRWILGRETEDDLKEGRQKSDVSYTDSTGRVVKVPRPAYVKVNNKHLDPYTLDVYELPWEWDERDPNYIIVKQWIPEPDQDILFEHTRKYHEQKLLTTTTTKFRKEHDQLLLVRKKYGEGKGDGEPLSSLPAQSEGHSPVVTDRPMVFSDRDTLNSSPEGSSGKSPSSFSQVVASAIQSQT